MPLQLATPYIALIAVKYVYNFNRFVLFQVYYNYISFTYLLISPREERKYACYFPTHKYQSIWVSSFAKTICRRYSIFVTLINFVPKTWRGIGEGGDKIELLDGQESWVRAIYLNGLLNSFTSVDLTAWIRKNDEFTQKVSRKLQELAQVVLSSYCSLHDFSVSLNLVRRDVRVMC